MHKVFAPFQVIEGDRSSGLVLLCDHARNSLPEEYGSLGLPASQFERHIAYDIGAEALTLGLAQRLGVPAVLSCFSRLLIDPNRGEDDPTIIMRLSDGTVVPGNHPISVEEIERRKALYYAPYHNAVTTVIDEALETGVNPIIFSIHSFTPVWKGSSRKWHASMLWDADHRLSKFIVDGLSQDSELIVGDNEPYDGALTNDTMYRHATRRGLAHGLLEVRQDLVADAQGVQQWIDRLAPLLEEANHRHDMHEIRQFGSRTDGTAHTGANP
ncbi:MAG: N-formylglutamate amidohydrolase [Rhizobiaceae bacterium]|nr:N-formylglutamate amidohydrolase [Rhizobiaceae bacterium]